MAVRPYGDHRDGLTDEQLADIDRMVTGKRRSGEWPPMPPDVLRNVARLMGLTLVRVPLPADPPCDDCGASLAPGPERRWVAADGQTTCPRHPAGHAWEGSPWVPSDA